MRLQISKSKNSSSLYVIKTIYINEKEKTKIVEKLGTYDDLKQKLDGQDPIEWAKKYVEALNKKEIEEKQEVLVKCSPSKLINKDETHSFNGGYKVCVLEPKNLVLDRLQQAENILKNQKEHVEI